MRKAAKMIVKGTVQGVFFRQFVKEHADDLKLKGYVRNISTGDVEIVIEGEQESIDRFLGLIKKGPQHSHIRDVKIEEKKWSGDFKEFKIMRF